MTLSPVTSSYSPNSTHPRYAKTNSRREETPSRCQKGGEEATRGRTPAPAEIRPSWKRNQVRSADRKAPREEMARDAHQDLRSPHEGGPRVRLAQLRKDRRLQRLRHLDADGRNPRRRGTVPDEPATAQREHRPARPDVPRPPRGDEGGEREERGAPRDDRRGRDRPDEGDRRRRRELPEDDALRPRTGEQGPGEARTRRVPLEDGRGAQEERGRHTGPEERPGDQTRATVGRHPPFHQVARESDGGAPEGVPFHEAAGRRPAGHPHRTTAEDQRKLRPHQNPEAPLCRNRKGAKELNRRPQGRTRLLRWRFLNVEASTGRGSGERYDASAVTHGEEQLDHQNFRPVQGERKVDINTSGGLQENGNAPREDPTVSDSPFEQTDSEEYRNDSGFRR